MKCYHPLIFILVYTCFGKIKNMQWKKCIYYTLNIEVVYMTYTIHQEMSFIC